MTLNSRHCRQTGVSPLHFVLRCLHDSQARGTRRLYRWVLFPGSWRGIATFALEALALANFASPNAGVELDVLPPRGASAPEGRRGVAGALCGPDCFAESSAAPSPGELYECFCFCFLLVMRAVVDTERRTIRLLDY